MAFVDDVKCKECEDSHRHRENFYIPHLIYPRLKNELKYDDAIVGRKYIYNAQNILNYLIARWHYYMSYMFQWANCDLTLE